jgi:hypothetical protein
MQGPVSTGEQATGRLIILLAQPVSSIIFSLLAAILIWIDRDVTNVAGVILFVFAGVAGFAGLITGGVVLVVQLTKSKIHLKNAVTFAIAWAFSVVVFIGSISISVS